jgi:hypothetical protein
MINESVFYLSTKKIRNLLEVQVSAEVDSTNVLINISRLMVKLVGI